jgi:hypothetical protein
MNLTYKITFSLQTCFVVGGRLRFNMSSFQVNTVSLKHIIFYGYVIWNLEPSDQQVRCWVSLQKVSDLKLTYIAYFSTYLFPPSFLKSATLLLLVSHYI